MTPVAQIWFPVTDWYINVSDITSPRRPPLATLPPTACGVVARGDAVVSATVPPTAAGPWPRPVMSWGARVWSMVPSMGLVYLRVRYNLTSAPTARHDPADGVRGRGPWGCSRRPLLATVPPTAFGTLAAARYVLGSTSRHGPADGVRGRGPLCPREHVCRTGGVFGNDAESLTHPPAARSQKGNVTDQRKVIGGKGYRPDNARMGLVHQVRWVARRVAQLLTDQCFVVKPLTQPTLHNDGLNKGSHPTIPTILLDLGGQEGASTCPTK